jgi:hypothetical protein
MGQLDDLKTHLWATFQQTLYAGSLRKYLKLLPDFEDVEAEEKALVNRPGFTGGQNSRRISRYGTDIKEENRKAVFT